MTECSHKVDVSLAPAQVRSEQGQNTVQPVLSTEQRQLRRASSECTVFMTGPFALLSGSHANRKLDRPHQAKSQLQTEAPRSEVGLTRWTTDTAAAELGGCMRKAKAGESRRYDPVRLSAYLLSRRRPTSL